MTSTPSISIIDAVVFGVFLLISVSIGIINGLLARGKPASDNASNDMLGGRDLPIVPTMLSVVATFLSGILILGSPSDIYMTGAVHYWITFFGGSLAVVFAGALMIPTFQRLQLVTLYEYLDMRFSCKFIRWFSASIFMVVSTLYAAIVLYAPSIALEAVTGYPMAVFILACGITCTIYTTIGGIKAVVWTDAFQAFFMYGGLMILIIRGVVYVGGPFEVHKVVVEKQRLEVYTGFSPLQYSSIWISLFGGFQYWLNAYGGNQLSVQRFLGLRSIRAGRIVFLLTAPAFFFMCCLATYLGHVVTAYFAECDPLLNGEITKRDQVRILRISMKSQMVILMAVRLLGDIPGLMGIFLATLFSGTLSTVSSAINSISAVLWHDFVSIGWKTASPQQANIFNKGMAVFLGVLTTGLAFFMGSLGAMIRSITVIAGAVPGPITAIVVLGVLAPRVNRLGVLISLAITETVTIIGVIGSFVSAPYKDYHLPLSTSQCPSPTTSQTIQNTTISQNYNNVDLHYGKDDVFWLFKISPFVMGLLSFSIQLILCILISEVASAYKEKEDERVRKLTFWHTANRTYRVDAGDQFNMKTIKL